MVGEDGEDGAVLLLLLRFDVDGVESESEKSSFVLSFICAGRIMSLRDV